MRYIINKQQHSWNKTWQILLSFFVPVIQKGRNQKVMVF